MCTSGDDVVGRLRGLAGRAHLALDRESVAQLAEYLALLRRWNERMNLTALDAGDEGLHRLVIEPLLAVRHIPAGSTAMIDIGSGGGSPAIPIKVARPELFVRMVEARTRRAAFLREVVRRLSLAGAAVENCRYEALRAREELRAAHDVLTVRGVRADASVGGALAEFVRPGGIVLLFCATGQPGLRLDAATVRVEGRIPLVEASGSEVVVARKMRR